MTSPLQSYDLTSISEEDIDFTTEFTLTPQTNSAESTTAGGTGSSPFNPFSYQWISSPAAASIPCCGIALWFDVNFSERFCSSHPITLSTSPFSKPTHWAQTVFTFAETIHLLTYPSPPGAPSTAGTAALAATAASATATAGTLPLVGSKERPIVQLCGRVSVARAARYRTVDVSVEVWGTAVDGAKRSWPAQVFTL